MITIDINIAIAIFFSFCFILVFGAWLVYNFSSENKQCNFQNAHIVQCPYCTHLFSDDSTELLRCPCCKSIIDPSDNRIAGERPS